MKIRKRKMRETIIKKITWLLIMLFSLCLPLSLSFSTKITDKKPIMDYSINNNEYNYKDFNIRQNKLVGLTVFGALQPVLTIPSNIQEIAPHAFKNHANWLERIIFECKHVKVDPTSFDDVYDPVKYYSTNTEVIEDLKKIGITVNQIQVDSKNIFFMLPLSLNSGKQFSLIGLTTKCINGSDSNLTLPQNIVEISSNAFNECPNTINLITFNDASPIVKIGKNAFSEVNNLTKCVVNNDETALAIINSYGNAPSGVEIHINGKKTKYSLINGLVLKNDEQNNSLIATNIRSTEQLFIPNQVTYILKNVFDGCQIGKILFTDFKNADSLTIENNAFSGLNNTIFVTNDHDMEKKLIIAGVKQSQIQVLNTVSSPQNTGWTVFTTALIILSVMCLVYIGKKWFHKFWAKKKNEKV